MHSRLGVKAPPVLVGLCLLYERPLLASYQSTERQEQPPLTYQFSIGMSVVVKLR